jgi:hypothetical protein
MIVRFVDIDEAVWPWLSKLYFQSIFFITYMLSIKKTD